MKYLILSLLTLFIWNAAHADWNLVTGTAHKTESGKYPFFFDDQGGKIEWTEANQKDYDEKMSATLKQLCSDNVQLGEVEKQYDGDTSKAHPEIGDKMKSLKDEIAHLSGIVVKGTGKSAREWGCQ